MSAVSYFYSSPADVYLNQFEKEIAFCVIQRNFYEAEFSLTKQA